MSYKNRTKFSLIVLILFCALLCVAVLQKTASAQTCTPPLFQGWVNSCQGLSIRWLNRNPIADIKRFEVRWHADAPTTPPTVLPGNAISLSRLAGCDFHSHVTITQVLNNGASCSVTSTGSAPHSFPCGLCQNTGGRLSTGNSASFQPFLAADAVGTGFSDSEFTTVTAYNYDADPNEYGYQLPKELGGVRAFVSGIQLGLFYVSPHQINFHIPKGMVEGLHPMTVSTQSGQTITGDVVINRNSPGIFTAEQNGQGQAMALWWQFRLGIFYRIYPVGSSFDVQPGDRMFLVLYGTGVNANRATLRINNRVYDSLYAGDVQLFVGLDQLNFEIPLFEIWNGSVGGQVTVWEPDGASWLSNGFTVTGKPVR